MGKRDVNGDLIFTTKTLMVGALSFTAAMAWRDLMRKIFEIRFGKRTSLKAYILYTLMVTLIAVIVVWMLSKIVNKK